MSNKQKHINKGEVEKLIRALLVEIGEDVDRPGLVDTPKRVANWWSEFIDFDPGTVDRTFQSVATDQMVIVKDMRVWSLCEHHLLPFWCDVSIAYIAREKVLGLSKFARIAHKYAHRLQIQERLVDQIANDVQTLTGSPDVAVVGKGTHLCMVMRGVKTQAEMSTSVMRGLFFFNPSARQEFVDFLS